LNFPQDSSKTSELNVFIKAILNKKLNHRICSFNKLKGFDFFMDFNWDDLIDFKVKPPFIPEWDEIDKQIEKFANPFEIFINVIIFYYNLIFN